MNQMELREDVVRIVEEGEKLLREAEDALKFAGLFKTDRHRVCEIEAQRMFIVAMSTEGYLEDHRRDALRGFRMARQLLNSAHDHINEYQYNEIDRRKREFLSEESDEGFGFPSFSRNGTKTHVEDEDEVYRIE
jgi:hypothetical protein